MKKRIFLIILTICIISGLIKIRLENEIIQVLKVNNQSRSQILAEEIDEETTNANVTGIELITNDDRAKSAYIMGVDTELNLSGRKLQLTKADGTTKMIPLSSEGVTTSGFKVNEVGTQTITVKYLGFETSFNIRVKEVESIQIIGDAEDDCPLMTEYIKGTPLHVYKIKVTYTNGSSVTILTDRNGVVVCGYDKNKLGTQTITVKFAGKECTQDITVVESQHTKEESKYHNNFQNIYWGEGDLIKKLDDYYYTTGVENENESNTHFSYKTTYNEYIEKLDALVAGYDTYIQKEELFGDKEYIDNEGNEYHFYSYTLGHDDNVNKPKIIITSGQHGTERGPIFGIYWFVYDILNHSNEVGQEFLKYIRDNVELIILPCMNPYGVDYNTYNNENDVNINRDYESFTQIESQIVGKKISEIIETNGAVLYIDFHSHNDITKSTFNMLYFWHYMSNVEEDYYSRKILRASEQEINLTQTSFKRYGSPDYAYQIGRIRYNVNDGESTARAWVDSKGILSTCLEGFNCLPNEVERYNIPEDIELYKFTWKTQKANAEILGNYLRLCLKSFIGEINESDVTLPQTEYVYNGEQNEPGVIVEKNNITLIEGTDYTVSYNNNIYPGTATVTITGIGDYEGEVTKTFTIKKKPIGECEISLENKFYTYDGEVKKPKVIVKRGDKTITEGISYTLEYENNIEAGKATVKIKAKNTGYYEGEAVVNFYIEETLSTNQQAIKDVAFAFYYRGTAMQYDDASMTDNVVVPRQRRSQFNHSPEDATMQDIQYSVCSEYVTNVFGKAFTYGNGMPYQVKNTNGENPVLHSNTYVEVANPDNTKYYNSRIAVDYIYAEPEEGETEDGKPKHKDIKNCAEAVKERIEEEIEPGDIMAFYTDSGWGHVMIYYGEGKIINCSSSTSEHGGTYQYEGKRDMYDSIGTIGIRDLETFVLTDTYIFKKDVTKIAILRPLNEIEEEGSDITISDETNKRMVHNKLVRTKLASVGKYDSVNIGDEITYTLQLENLEESEKYKNIKIEDRIPENTEFVSATNGYILENNNLEWTVDISAGKTVEVSYTVRVKNDKNLLGKTVLNNNTIIDNIKMNTIETTIGKTLTKNEKTMLINNVENYLNAKFSTTAGFINKVYNNKLNLPDNNNGNLQNNDNGNLQSVDTLFGELFTNGTKKMKGGEKAFCHILHEEDEEITIFKLTNKDDMYHNMIVKGLFGGKYTIKEDDSSNTNDNRNTTYTKDTFMVGDVLLVYDPDADIDIDTYVVGKKNLYLYLGENIFATVKDGHAIKMTATDGARLIDSLLGQNCFIVLRPSYVIEKTSLYVESEAYEIDEVHNYIEKLGPKTTVEEIKEAMTTNATEIKLFNKDGEELSNLDIVGTNTTVHLKNADGEMTLTIIVTGDTDGNGEVDFWDMIAINKHRLELELLGEVETLAGDVTKDGVTDFWDMIEINKIRLGLRKTV